MFFKKRIDGNEFGYYLAELTDKTAQKLDLQLEKRLGRGRDSVLNDIELIRQLRVFNSVLNKLEFSLIWMYALKELICLLAKGRHVNKLSNGFDSYIFKEYGDSEDARRLSYAVEMIIDKDHTLSTTGHLQPYDENNKLEISDRTGLSYEITRLTVKEALVIDDLEDYELQSLISALVLEFETMFRLGAHLYRSVKVT